MIENTSNANYKDYEGDFYTDPVWDVEMMQGKSRFPIKVMYNGHAVLVNYNDDEKSALCETCGESWTPTDPSDTTCKNSKGKDSE